MEAWDRVPFAELRDAMETGTFVRVSGPVGEFGRLGIELFDPDIRFSVAAVEAYAVIWPRGEGSGYDEWLALWTSWYASWESIDVRPGDTFEVGDTVIQEFHAHLIGRGSGVELDVDHFHLFRFEGERVVEFTIEPTREAAIEAAQASR